MENITIADLFAKHFSNYRKKQITDVQGYYNDPTINFCWWYVPFSYFDMVLEERKKQNYDNSFIKPSKNPLKESSKDFIIKSFNALASKIQANDDQNLPLVNDEIFQIGVKYVTELKNHILVLK